jgi:hypothetical protein
MCLWCVYALCLWCVYALCVWCAWRVVRAARVWLAWPANMAGSVEGAMRCACERTRCAMSHRYMSVVCGRRGRRASVSGMTRHAGEHGQWVCAARQRMRVWPSHVVGEQPTRRGSCESVVGVTRGALAWWRAVGAARCLVCAMLYISMTNWPHMSLCPQIVGTLV